MIYQALFIYRELDLFEYVFSSWSASKKDFFLKIADFSVIANISVKIKFEVMQILLWPTKLDENKALTKIFTQSYTKIWTWKRGSIFWNLRKSWKTKIFHFPVSEAKICYKGFYYLIQLDLHVYSTLTF